jgi:hypothetical protein
LKSNLMISALCACVMAAAAHGSLADSGAMPSAESSASSQDTTDLQHVMDAFHQAVVRHDGARLASLFIPAGSTWLNVLTDSAYTQAKMKTPTAQKVRVGSYKSFADFVSASRSDLNPQHSNIRIHGDGTIASIYFDFVFLIDGKEENRGSETWQLVKGADGWRIAAITYSSSPHAP